MAESWLVQLDRVVTLSGLRVLPCFLAEELSSATVRTEISFKVKLAGVFSATLFGRN